ncbi:hypothetical protein Tco_0432473 [Tanacetum coccineum]
MTTRKFLKNLEQKRKKSLPRKSTRSAVKRQKMELNDEKEDLKGYLDIVTREDVAEAVHILLMQNGIAIHMLTEKKYPLSQEMLSKMLSKRLEVDHESTQAYELLKSFIQFTSAE